MPLELCPALKPPKLVLGKLFTGRALPKPAPYPVGKLDMGATPRFCPSGDPAEPKDCAPMVGLGAWRPPKLPVALPGAPRPPPRLPRPPPCRGAATGGWCVVGKPGLLPKKPLKRSAASSVPYNS